MIVITRTPLRISFFGGGTDLADFFSTDYGAVMSTAIDKYVYVTVKAHGELFDEPYRLNYSKTEIVKSLDEVDNEIGREALRLTSVPAPVYISTVADVPSGSGLGSSSSYAVGLLNALAALQAARFTPGDLAEMACHLEIDVLGKPIGKQDQYSAAFGGLNYIRFNADHSTSLVPLNMSQSLRDLFANLMLFWTGTTRQADAILREQRENITARRRFLVDMRDMADTAMRLIRENRLDVRTFGEMLDAAWHLKRELASGISNERIDTWYQAGRKAGAWGGKLCGAGGDGFLLFCVAPEHQKSVRRALSDLRELPIRYEPMGSSVLYPTAQAFPHYDILPTMMRDGRERYADHLVDSSAG